MWITLIIAVIGVILFIAFRNRNSNQVSTTSTSNTQHRNDISSMHHAQPLRDYIKEAESFTKAPRPIREMLLEDRAGVLRALEKYALEAEESQQIGGMSIPMGPAIRKAAVYALGQIGDQSSGAVLRTVASKDEASGVRNAATAAIVAIEKAPSNTGHSELERQQIIKSVYDTLPG